MYVDGESRAGSFSGVNEHGELKAFVQLGPGRCAGLPSLLGQAVELPQRSGDGVACRRGVLAVGTVLALRVSLPPLFCQTASTSIGLSGLPSW